MRLCSVESPPWQTGPFQRRGSFKCFLLLWRRVSLLQKPPQMVLCLVQSRLPKPSVRTSIPRAATSTAANVVTFARHARRNTLLLSTGSSGGQRLSVNGDDLHEKPVITSRDRYALRPFHSPHYSSLRQGRIPHLRLQLLTRVNPDSLPPPLLSSQQHGRAG